MTDEPSTQPADHPAIGKSTPIPPDDQTRQLVVADRDSDDVTQVFLAGDVYSMLITGEQTNGVYCLIDMQVPDGGGPPLHRHNFEEMFSVLDGEITVYFRDTQVTARAGTTVNVPANAPHHFRNHSGAPARVLCMCSPAGQDEFFLRCGDVIDSRSAPPPQLSADELAERRRRAVELSPLYATEQLPDDGK